MSLPTSDDQILTVAQMQAAEQALFDTGTSVEELMEIAAGGAAEWIRRIAAGGSVTVLCGPGNNGGDGYVIARLMREFGNDVRVVAPTGPKTDAAKAAREKWAGPVQTSGRDLAGRVLVDCLFGSGLSRALSGEYALLLRDLASRHDSCVAIDVPSGVESDSGALLNDKLPDFDVTLALGAWKFAHFTLPARSKMGRKKLVPIGIGQIENAATLVCKPIINPPARDAQKYTRGLCAVVGGAMPGAALLASEAARRAGAGYVKLLSRDISSAPAGLVVDAGNLSDALADSRINAVLIGPGLGRGEGALLALKAVLKRNIPTVLDADTLQILEPGMIAENASILATPHDGELAALCKRFAVIADDRRAKAQALAKVSGMVILAKGPDSVIAAPDGRIALAPAASSWLSTAGTGDVLAGITVSRMATGADPFDAACQAVWLHAEAARLSGAAFTPDDLAQNVSSAIASAL